MQYVIALCLLLSFFTFVCMHTWRTILRKRTILRSNEEEIRGIGVSRRGGGRRSEEREKGFFFRSNDRKRVDGRTSSSYINEFVFDLSNRYRQRRQIIDSKEKETNRVLRNELLKVCANCRPGGAHDGGVLLDKTTGLCTAWCSKGNYCGETATYKSSSKSVDCRTLSTFEGSDDDVAYEVWKSNVESQFAFGKAARDLLTCVECRSGHNSDGGVQRFRDQFCDRWCSVSPWGLPGGYCGTSGGYRNGGTDCQFMARFHDDANKLVAEWIDLVRRQLDANPDDTMRALRIRRVALYGTLQLAASHRQRFRRGSMHYERIRSSTGDCSRYRLPRLSRHLRGDRIKIIHRSSRVASCLERGSIDSVRPRE